MWPTEFPFNEKARYQQQQQQQQQQRWNQGHGGSSSTNLGRLHREGCFGENPEGQAAAFHGKRFIEVGEKGAYHPPPAHCAPPIVCAQPFGFPGMPGPPPMMGISQQFASGAAPCSMRSLPFSSGESFAKSGIWPGPAKNAHLMASPPFLPCPTPVTVNGHGRTVTPLQRQVTGDTTMEYGGTNTCHGLVGGYNRARTHPQNHEPLQSHEEEEKTPPSKKSDVVDLSVDADSDDNEEEGEEESSEDSSSSGPRGRSRSAFEDSEESEDDLEPEPAYIDPLPLQPELHPEVRQLLASRKLRERRASAPERMMVYPRELFSPEGLMSKGKPEPQLSNKRYKPESPPPSADKKPEPPLSKAEKAERALMRARRHSSADILAISALQETDKEVRLGPDFVPGNWDVVCGRGKNWLEFISNRRFRILVAIYLPDYFEGISRTCKSIVINTIVTTIQNAGGEGFVKKKGRDWYRITTKEAREKVSHCLRDCLTDPQNEQLKWSKAQRLLKLKEAQNNVFRSLELTYDSSS